MKKYEVYKYNKATYVGKIVAEFDNEYVAKNYIKAMQNFEEDKNIEYRIW